MVFSGSHVRGILYLFGICVRGSCQEKGDECDSD